MSAPSTPIQSPRSNRLSGKIALVTGAARGIGAGIAICLAEEGADVIVNDLPPSDMHDGGALTAHTIEALGRRAFVVSGDVSHGPDVARIMRETVERYGRLDIAVANAAYSDREPVIAAHWEGVLRTIEVTQFGVFHTCQHAARHMLAQGAGGKIIIIGSLLAQVPYRKSAAYNMAKAAVNHFGRTLANELTDYRINVNVINPGYIDTPGERKFASERELADSARNIPWRRLGTPRDIGRAAVFLASDDAEYITGASLVIDGGYHVGMTLPSSSAS